MSTLSTTADVITGYEWEPEFKPGDSVALDSNPSECVGVVVEPQEGDWGTRIIAEKDFTYTHGVDSLVLFKP